MRILHVLLLIPITFAFQLPFQIPFFKSKGLAVEEEVFSPSTPRIAIIGAGAGGSSAAFWISKAKERFGVDVEVDVYEAQSYIGGRSTTVYPYGNTSLPELELGASIFVEANKNLWRASDEFNLTRRNFEEEGGETGIWDGQNILISFGGSWWDTVKMLWRYGVNAPRKTQSIVSNMIKEILVLYSADSPKWDNVTVLATSLGWKQLVQNTAFEYLTSQNVSPKFVDEVVDAATRVNYGQNANEIHALEGTVSMAASGAVAIKGGNFQMFEQFLKHSGAKVLLNTSVNAVFQKSSSSHHWTVKSSRGSEDYKAVILAAPFHSTGITLPLSLSDQIPKQPYVHLHVTLLTTTSPSFNPVYFGLPEGAKVPRAVLTTAQGGKEPEFNSLSYHGLVREGEWAVKIFSKERLSDEWLQNLFTGKVGWIYRKEWEAYPKLPPTESFPPVKLDQGFYYVNSFEPFISTMETETVASRNVVDLLLNEEFRSSICGARLSSSAPEQNTKEQKEFVFGWDC